MAWGSHVYTHSHAKLGSVSWYDVARNGQYKSYLSFPPCYAGYNIMKSSLALKLILSSDVLGWAGLGPGSNGPGLGGLWAWAQPSTSLILSLFIHYYTHFTPSCTVI